MLLRLFFIIEYLDFGFIFGSYWDMGRSLFIVFIYYGGGLFDLFYFFFLLEFVLVCIKFKKRSFTKSTRLVYYGSCVCISENKVSRSTLYLTVGIHTFTVEEIKK